ncbi:hypothetical protein [Mycoplasmoides fastidiosum]|nr:hypothetical protein [Mycoplasmoides fastidiosum]
MCLVLLFSYVLFILNWFALGRLQGNELIGWISHFFGVQGTSIIVTQAINYGSTFIRGIVTILASWLLVKLTHRYASLISLLLMMSSLVAVYLPNFVLFVIGIMVMAMGGTTTIMFVKPIMAQFLPKKTQSIISLFMPWAYSSGALVAFGLFVYEPWETVLIQNWQITAGIIAALNFIPLVLYFFLGRNFSIKKTEMELEDPNLKPSSYLAIIKEKQTWIWILLYGLWLVLAVLLVFLIFPTLTDWKSDLNGDHLNNLDWKNLVAVSFFVGSFFGIWVGFWSWTSNKFKHYLSLIILLILISFIGMVLSVHYGIIWLSIVMAFLLGNLIIGVQAILLYIPYLYKNWTSKRLSIFFGYLWGFGYILYSFINIFSVLIITNWGYLAIIVFVGILILLFLGCSLVIKEPRPQGNNWKLSWSEIKSFLTK